MTLGTWREGPDGFARRRYADYDAYAKHQGTKVLTMSAKRLEDIGRALRLALPPRLKTLGLDWRGRSVLCLGARAGDEVDVFIELGCFAVGIDINPPRGNPYVLAGDFHSTVFPQACVDVVYTNALDHVFDLRDLVLEARRLLKPGGLFIVDACLGTKDGKGPGDFESFAWPTVSALVAGVVLAADAFRLSRREPFAEPWPGEQLVFEARE